MLGKCGCLPQRKINFRFGRLREIVGAAIGDYPNDFSGRPLPSGHPELLSDRIGPRKITVGQSAINDSYTGRVSGIGGTEVSPIQNGQAEEIEVAGRD